MTRDSRIKVLPLAATHRYNKWVAGYDMTVRTRTWPSPMIHLLSLKDQAIDLIKLEMEADWIVITNGDNWYNETFLDHVPTAETYVDMVLVDYWSRYDSVDLKIENMSSTVCHRAELKVGMVDLGGVILSFKRFRAEGYKFMSMGPINSQGQKLYR